MPIYKSQGHYINGAWKMDQGRPFESINPATDDILWKGVMATPQAVQAAYDAAKRALPAWRELAFETRVTYLEQFIQQVNLSLPFLANKLSEETGKPLWETTAKLKTLPEKLSISIEAFKQRAVEMHTVLGDQTLRLQFKPLGVVAVLGAFNFPIHLSHGHLIPALLAGNTTLFKPSELTPAIAEYFMNCWDKSGLPPGVINLIQGNGEVAQHMLSLPLQGVYFTGSYQTGQAIQANFQSRPEVLLALEMGGNNPFIIDEVEDMEAAVYHALVSSYITAGQRCSCTRRLIVPETKWGKRFLEYFIDAAQKLIIGPYDAHPEPFMGPVIRRSYAHHYLEKQKQRITQGGKPLLKMTLLGDHGAFLTPGVLDMQAAHPHEDEEIFAPLVQVYRYTDFDQAIHLANQTKFGLAAGLISDDAKRYDHFSKKMCAGVLSWNRPTTGASPNLPFGGVGKSGNHRPSAFFATDYCVYPVASLEQKTLQLPGHRMPGVSL
jgi:succinylglutamic semialdehyde dehydrogenase